MLRIKVFFIYIFLPVLACSQNFVLTISHSEDEFFNDVIEDSNGDYVFCGSIGNYNSDQLNDYDGYLLKVNAVGDTLLSKRFTTSQNYMFMSNIIEIDTFYLVFGHFLTDSSSVYKLFIMKVDKNFNEIWKKGYGKNDYIYYLSFENVIINKENIITGIGTAFHPTFYGDFFVYQFNIDGDSLNARYYQLPGLQLGFDIIELPDNAGYKVFTFGSPVSSVLLGDEVVTIDNNLNIVSIVSVDTVPIAALGTTFYGIASSKWLNDTTYLLYARLDRVEYFGQTIDNSKDVGLLFMNSNDSILSAHYFGKPDTPDVEAFHGLDYIYKSAIYIGCTSNYTYDGWPSFSNQKNFFNLNKIDSTGNLIWSKFYGGDANHVLNKVLATQDGGCLMVGTRYDSATANGDERDIYIIKVASDGVILSTTDNLHELPKGSFTLYPNPGNDVIHIKGNFLLPAYIELIDVTGKVMINQKLFSNSQQIDVSSLHKGIYCYIIRSDNKFAFGKWIKY